MNPCILNTNDDIVLGSSVSSNESDNDNDINMDDDDDNDEW